MTEVHAQNGSLKVLDILDHSLPFHSGYALRSYNILRAHAKQDFDAVALTSPEHNRITGENEIRRETIAGFRHYRTRATHLNVRQFARAYRDALVLTLRISEVIELENPDVLHVHSPVFNAYPALFSRFRTGIPLVYEVRAFWDAAVNHGSYQEDSWQYNSWRLWRNGPAGKPIKWP